jgi:hypothetical protein
LIATAIGSVLLAVVAQAYLLPRLLGGSDSGEQGLPKLTTITITNEDEVRRDFSGEVILRGKVENLRPGQTVWAFERLLDAPGITARGGACPVESDGTWVCPAFPVGTPGRDKGVEFRLFASVLDDSDVPTQVELAFKRGQGQYGPMDQNSRTPPGLDYDHVDGSKK